MVNLPSACLPEGVRALLSYLATEAGKTDSIAISTWKVRVKTVALVLNPDLAVKEGRLNVTLTYHDNTGRIHSQCPAVIEDQMLVALRDLDEKYGQFLAGKASADGLPERLPRDPRAAASASAGKGSAKLPTDPTYYQGVNMVAQTVVTYLQDFPEQKNRLLDLLTKDFGLSMTQEPNAKDLGGWAAVDGDSRVPMDAPRQ